MGPVHLEVCAFDAHVGAPDRGRHLLGVQRRDMVVLLERVREQLPVAVVVRDEVVAFGERAERVPVERRDHRPEELPQALPRLASEIDEDEPVPHLAVDGRETVSVPLDAEELVLLLNERELAVEAVAPAVILADELAAYPLRFFARELVPYELVAAVAADVVEGAHSAALVAHHDDRGARDLDLPGHVAADARHILDPPDVQPRPLEDRLALERVELRRHAVRERDRAGPGLRVGLRPAALGWFGKTSHARPCPQTSDPPLTASTCPVMKLASSDARNITAAATSSPVPRRPTGIDRTSSSFVRTCPACCESCSIGVAMPDGWTLLTVMPEGPYSRASVLVKVTTAAFDEA